MSNVMATNSRGDTFSFTSPFRLVRIDGLSGLPAQNFYSESTKDGSTRTGTKLSNRNVEIEFQLRKQKNMDAEMIEHLKNHVYTVFNPTLNPIRLDITSKAGKQYYLYANADVAPSFGVEKQAYIGCLIQFSCDDPNIYDANEEKSDVASWVSTFEFPLEIPAECIEFGYREQSLIVNVFNGGQIATGMTIRFKAIGTVVNPSLLNVNTQEYIKLKTTMQAGDVIEVSTYIGKKYVKLTRSGVTTDSMNLLDITSTFLQLDVGDNLFRYDADSNLENLEVDVLHRNTLIGV